MTHDDPRHGTNAGYSQGCREPCCRAAHARYNLKVRKVAEHYGIRRSAPAIGYRRRLQALIALRWPQSYIANRLGIRIPHLNNILHNRYTNETMHFKLMRRTEALYNELCMTPGPSARAARIARKHSWATPLAWTDIDDPDETPSNPTSASTDIDPIVVERLLAGHRIPATKAEQEEVVRRVMADPDRTLADLERRTGLPIHKIAERLRLRDRRAA